MSAPAFRPISTPRAFEAILLQLKEAIGAGHLRAGSRLPSERELASQFGVSRASVREALRVLEALGLVGTRRGADNGAVLLSEPGNAFTTVLDLLVALRHVPLADVVEFRVMLETNAVRRLASDPGSALETLRSLLDRMADPALDQASFHQLDASFHVTLVRSAGNRLVNLVETAADSTLRSLIADVALVANDWSSVRPRLIAEHQAIYDAIAAAEAGLAEERTAAHVRFWGDAVIAASHDLS
ncbi:FadR/GntR family transcriptional regulator [Virgisporangium aurantiacum]|uniref:GntR family transcriptional regulator n=1 Tax=Virgisporangium aurantiacum TaxID=175570 RepID=A0A8J3ZEM7_9ACTN|nr:GntR family transcriptional regulator [Virgisporangium aurantiacum]GIJ62749.1 GntR family transcriptional regulator [Virgisporangium aurantiacum]